MCSTGFRLFEQIKGVSDDAWNEGLKVKNLERRITSLGSDLNKKRCQERMALPWLIDFVACVPVLLTPMKDFENLSLSCERFN